MPARERIRLASAERFNELTADLACQVLRECCSSQSWALALVVGRPYSSADALLAASDQATSQLTAADLAQALAGHPRLGATALTGRSGREQAALAAADDHVLRELAEASASYEKRFGHIYLACATGRSGSELLEYLRRRLDNARETEWRVVAAELAKINRIRLRELIGGLT